MANKTDDLLLYAVGDVAPYREDPGSIFQRVADTLGKADIAFCQLEINLTDRGTPLPQARLAMRADPITAQAIKEAGFNIVSFASNHCMDWGREAFFDTINALKEQGLPVIGVGSNIEEARKPAFVESKGTKIAFLSYNTILPQGYWAEINRPGCAPMRGLTVYEQIEHDQPGTPSRIHTFPRKDDLQAMASDIRQAKSQADLVILSMHWGIHFIPAVIADYQREVARAAIDAGADLILGHHAHILKGVEVYSGKVVFYSLCNFALDLSPTKEILENPGHKEISALNLSWQPDPEYPTYFLPPDSRKTMIAKCVITDKEIKNVSFLPTYINKQSQPEILSSQDERFGEVVGYMEEITRDQELNAKYVIEGDEVLIQEA
ncbi:MAG: CapA family protein [Dehalococcoidales bacterium]|nr:MAG: CapA family protein [Dehalococcoidales bacterium]